MRASAQGFAFEKIGSRSAESSPARGILLGITLSFEPAPPVQDVLTQALTLPQLPAYQPPRDTLAIRLSTVLGTLGWSSREKELHQLWRVQAATAMVMASLVPSVARELDASGWLARHQSGGRFRVGPITHPYDVLEAFKAVTQVSEAVTRERRSLDLILGLLLRQYEKTVSESIGMRFSFEAEAKEHFLRGAKLERGIKHCHDTRERLRTLQHVVDAYTHAKNYYMFSVIARDKSDNDGKMFMMYCHAALSLAQIDWDGTTRDQPVLARLPSRGEAMFLFSRDRGLRERCAQDPNLLAQTKALMAGFRD